MISDHLPVDRIWKAQELRKLPPAERDAILAEAASRALSDYHSNRGLTDFEAFGADDLHGESTST